jgi:glutathione S-transferase
VKLYCSNGSPFARKVRVVLAEMALPYEADVADGLRPTSGELGPTLAIPVLEDGEQRLWESDIVIDYLLKTYPEAVARSACTPKLSPWLARPDRHWHDMTVLATIHTCATSLISLRLMANDGIGPENSDYMARQATRVERCLDWLEGQVTDEGFVPGWFSILDIAFICPMDFAEKRGIIAWRGRRKLDALFDRYLERPSLKATPVDVRPPIKSRYVVRRELA